MLFASGALVLSGCAGQPFPPVIHTSVMRVTDELVRFTSCSEALRNLRAAAIKAHGGAGFAAGPSTLAANGGNVPGAADRGPAALPAGAPAAVGQAGAAGQTGSASAGGVSDPSSYSATNAATAGVDEPDLVKTDGRRIVTVIGGVLRVIDAQTKQLTGILDLSTWAGLDGATVNLLLAGNHALVLFDQAYPLPAAPVPARPGSALGTQEDPAVITGPRLVLIDLSAATPRIMSEYTIDGVLVDARQVGSIARVVVHSAPRVLAPYDYALSGQERTTDERAMITHATLSAWLPRYAVTSAGVQHTGRVSCAAVSHPVAVTYSGSSMLTVLTFDLSSDSLGDGQPVTVVADGDTVYSNGSSLYIANDRQWIMPQDPVTTSSPTSSPASAAAPAMSPQYAGLYQFDISGPGRPVYEASGAVPGWLLGSADTAQYALSEWNGALRVATTTGLFGWSGPPPQSAVYVLEQVGAQLVIIGKVGGLGQGDQIYAVRFAGPVGYVVTYRSVDPLYTLDLADPAQPRVAGDLLLSGYSAYLDPIDPAHVIGIGQATNASGQIQGTQISLFDVSDLAAPVRTAVYRLPFGHSEAEIDPHAFLYWPASGLLVIPVQIPYAAMPPPPPGSAPAPPGEAPPPWPVSAALVLHVGDHSISEVGIITHPVLPGVLARGQIRRSLVIGSELWTVSDSGLKANDVTTLAPLGWVPFE